VIELSEIESSQKLWGWKIAAYLFLAGMGGGAYVVGAVADYLSMPGGVALSQLATVVGPGLVFVGLLFLIADLGPKSSAYLAYKKPGTSWIARGTIIISAFMILGAINVIGWIWPFRILATMPDVRHALGLVTCVFALGTMVYTGLLLGANKAIPLWSTAVVPLLFFVSALSTGIMGLILLLYFYGALLGPVVGRQLELLASLDLYLIALEALIVYAYLQVTQRDNASRVSVKLMLRGRLSTEFWVGIIVLGLAIPLLTEVAAALGASSSQLLLLPAASACGLLGGLFLRHVVLAAGVKAPLEVGSMTFSVQE
jgi:formate-dependent nitrite reductase membrane component NrfD